jgi:4-amino-4-deoxy-L-arabinose transferase-like glycosyltransferase
LAILSGYLLVGALFALLTPAWQAPDEPAHYNYIAQLARHGCCPVIASGDWDSAYLDQLKSARFASTLLDKLDRVQYEDHQPPLYYLLQAPLFTLTGGSLIALRLFSVVMGAGIVICAYGIGRTVAPGRPPVALGAAALVAFLPQHLAILASVNNDALGNLMIAVTLLAAIFYLRTGRVHPWQLGILVGLGLITKVSTIFLVGIVPLAILLRSRRSSVVGTGYISSLRAFAIPVLLIAGVWWARSVSVYGFPDIFGLREHNLVVADQPRTADMIAQVGIGAYLQIALQTTFNSFWGQFGWMALPLPGWMYGLFLGLMLAAGSGLAIYALTPGPSGRRELGGGEEMRPYEVVEHGSNGVVWIILLATLALAVLQYLYYNLEFLQLQGRYMFAGLIPFALLMALGVDSWIMNRKDAEKKAKKRILPFFGYGTVLPFALLAALDVYLLWRVIVPNLSP